MNNLNVKLEGFSETCSVNCVLDFTERKPFEVNNMICLYMTAGLKDLEASHNTNRYRKQIGKGSILQSSAQVIFLSETFDLFHAPCCPSFTAFVSLPFSTLCMYFCRMSRFQPSERQDSQPLASHTGICNDVVNGELVFCLLQTQRG